MLAPKKRNWFVNSSLCPPRVETPVRCRIAGAATLRAGTPAVVGRIEDDRLILDLRTVDPARDEELGAAVERALAPGR